MGDFFSEKYYQMAVNTYQFLLRDYPANRYREDAMLAIAQIEKDDLRDAVLAKKSYEEFLTLHPRSPHATEVRAILDQFRGDSASTGSASKLSAARDRSSPDSPDRSTPKPTITEKSPAATAIKEEASTESGVTSGARPRVTKIRAWNTDSYTRILLDVGAQVKYQAARLSNPDRIYFDVENAKIDPERLHKAVDVEVGAFLKSLRVWQNKLDVLQEDLEIDLAKDYSASLITNPYRMGVDVYGDSS